MHLFGTTYNNAVYTRFQDTLNDDTQATGWFTGWQQLSGRATMIAAETGSDGRAVLVGIDEDGTLFIRKMTVANAQTELEWSAATPLDGVLDSIDMARNANGSLMIVGTDADGQMFQRFETAAGSGQFGAWSQISGVNGDTPIRFNHVACERNGVGRVELFAVADDGMLWHSKQAALNTPTWAVWGATGKVLRPHRTFFV